MDDLWQVAELGRPRIEELGHGLPMEGRKTSPTNRAKWTWTRRRIDVLQLLSQGVHRALIAAELGITRKTVDNHICEMMAQMGARDWQELVQKAVEVGLVPAPAVSG